METLMSLFLELSGLSGMGMISFIAFWLVLLSAIQAFFGYKLMRLWIIVNGVCLGAFLGTAFGGIIGVNIGDSSAIGWAMFGLFAGAVLGGIIANKFWKVGVFILCFTPCFLVGMLTLGLMFQNISAGAFLGVAVGCAGGYFAVKYVKPVVIIVTSVVSGLSAGLGMAMISPALGAVVGLICIFGGFYFQCITNGNAFGIGTGKINSGNLFRQDEGSQETAASASKREDNEKSQGETSGARGFADRITANLKSTVKAPAQVMNRAQGSESGSVNSIAPIRNSKLRTALTAAPVKIHNDREYFFKGSPIVLPQIQIADIDMEGNIGLYLSIQNITTDKRVVAVYFDIHCYNVLKEKLKELKNIPLLDLSIPSGEIIKTAKAINLPEHSIRKCELIPRHVVFSDEQIWNYEGDAAFTMAPLQEKLTLPSQELTAEFKKEIENATKRRADDFTWQPTDFGDFWYCGCGQLNTASKCVCCGIAKAVMFEAADQNHLKILYGETLAKLAREKAERERQEEELRLQKEERDAERRRKLAELQSRTKCVLGAAAAKGKETIQKAGSASIQAIDSLKKQENKPSVIQCPKCNAVCSQDDKFCKSCGTVLPADRRLCEKCGFENDEDSRFCMNCGAALSNDESSED